MPVPSLKRAIRVVRNNKLVFSINLLGLSIGIASFILIVIWVQKELTYNDFLKKENVYEVITNYKVNTEINSVRATSYPLIRAIGKDIPEIEAGTYTMGIDDKAIGTANKSIRSIGKYTSPEFFNVVPRPFLFGSPANALADPLSIVISSSLAEKIYGKDWRQKIEGNYLLLDNWKELTVSGVFESFPKNSTIQADYFLPISPDSNDNVGNFNYDLYLKLNAKANPLKVTDKINSRIANLTKSTLFLQPFKDVYLYSDFSNGKVDGGRISYVRLFIAASIFILLMACINFMNLNIANSFRKTKELGIKKILGAERLSLIRQLMGEAYSVILVSICIALVLVYFSLPAMNSFLSESLSFPSHSLQFWLFLVGLFLAVGLLASIYPAFVLTSFDPLGILREKREVKVGGIGILKALFVFQFFISVLVIYIAYTSNEQVRYLLNKDIGYNKKDILCKKLSQDQVEKIPLIKADLNAQSFLSHNTFGSNNLLTGGPMVGGVLWPGRPNYDSTKFAVLFADRDFVRTMRVPLLTGDFGAQSGADISVVLNRSAARLMGGETAILNKMIEVWGSKARVTGIVGDFNFNSLYNRIEPLIIADYPSQAEYLFVRPTAGRQQDAMRFMEGLDKKYNQGRSMDYYWIEDRISDLYRDETNMGKLSSAFGILCIIISLSGLFGLANFTILRKMREMSIRKVLGGNVTQLVLLMFRDFIKLIVVASIIAVPVSYLFLHRWLEKFAYRINLTPLSFIIPLFGMGFVIALIVAYYSRKVGKVNPVKILREN